MTTVGRITRMLVALTTVLALIVVGAPASASAADTGTVEGSITNADGGPVLGSQIFFRNVETGATTSTYVMSGSFTARWLVPGDYLVWIDSSNNTRPEQYTHRWYPGASDAATATPITVTAGVTTDASWQVGAAGPGVTGIVSDARSGEPMANVRVDITGPGLATPTWTNSAGRYRFSALAAGRYEVATSIDSHTAPLSHAPSRKMIDVADGFVAWNVEMDPTGGLSVVTNQTGLDAASAELYRVGSSWSIPLNADGDTIEAQGLVPGDYELFLAPNSASHDFVSTWWPTAETRAAALPITVTSGETTELTWELARGARVSGRLTSAGASTPPGNGWVTATDTTGRVAGSSTVDAEGRYRISSLRPGTYVLKAVITGHTTVETTVSVTLGQDISRDFALRRKGQIAATMTAPAGTAPAERMSVYDRAMRLVTTASFQRDGARATATTIGLDAGDYYVTTGGAEGILFGWYGGSTAFAGATPITVTPGETVTVTLPAVAATSRNSGAIDVTLRGPQGEAVDNNFVEVYDADGVTRRITQTTVDRAVLDGLPPGEYRLRFGDSGSRDRHPFAETWWGGTSLADAARVRVTAGATTTISATMKRTLPAESASISGTLASPVPALTAGTRVRAWKQASGVGSPHLGGTGIVDGQGRYVIPGLLPGTYYLQIEDHPRWWYSRSPLFMPGVSGWATATPYVVTAGQSLRVDYPLHDRSTYSGVGAVRGIVRVGAVPAGGVDVRITSGGWTAIETTDADGFFEQDVEAGSFTVEVAETGKTARFTKTFTGANGRVTSADIALKRKVATTRPTLPSTVRVGSTTTATVSGWTSGATLSYQWRRDGTAIKGATGRSYRPVAADRGRKLTVAVTGRKSGYATVSRSSASRVVDYGRLTTSRPTISGTRRVGKELSVMRGSWTAGAEYTYRWYANGSKIAGATKRTYTLTGREVGDTITVKVTARKTGYATASRTSAATRPISR